jgi:hypothetical protein
MRETKVKKENGAGSGIKELERAKLDAGDLASAAGAHVAELVRLRSETVEGIETDATEAKESREKFEAELRADMNRLRTDLAVKVGKVREIQSRFAFTGGIVGEPLQKDLAATLKTMERSGD